MPARAEATNPALYAYLGGQLAALLSGETDPIANVANTAALLFHQMPDLIPPFTLTEIIFLCRLA